MVTALWPVCLAFFSPTPISIHFLSHPSLNPTLSSPLSLSSSLSHPRSPIISPSPFLSSPTLSVGTLLRTCKCTGCSNMLPVASFPCASRSPEPPCAFMFVHVRACATQTNLQCLVQIARCSGSRRAISAPAKDFQRCVRDTKTKFLYQYCNFFRAYTRASARGLAEASPLDMPRDFPHPGNLRQPSLALGRRLRHVATDAPATDTGRE
jgi:hypothetical protein